MCFWKNRTNFYYSERQIVLIKVKCFRCHTRICLPSKWRLRACVCSFVYFVFLQNISIRVVTRHKVLVDWKYIHETIGERARGRDVTSFRGTHGNIEFSLFAYYLTPTRCSSLIQLFFFKVGGIVYVFFKYNSSSMFLVDFPFERVFALFYFNFRRAGAL